ncbi:MAG: 2-succinylbenzoate--CoA ligase [Cyanophyceae cyanobacterium]
MIEASRILIHLEQRLHEDWLIGYSAHQFYHLVQAHLALIRRENVPTILLAEPNPWRFLAAFLAAVAAECPVFLANPHWKQQEWQQVFELVQPDLIWGTVREEQNLKSDRLLPPASIMIPTGGSSGKIRFAMHTWETLAASVRGFHRYFGSRPVNSFCILPLYHVSGLMQFLRSFLTGGRLLILSYKAIKEGARGDDLGHFFISLVPTQLQYLLQTDPQWLSRFQTVLLGGSPGWPSLFDTARNHHIRLAPTYGMTETASQIVTLKPKEFLQGNNSSGQVLPHAQVEICSDTGQRLASEQTGTVTIRSGSLCLGYYPTPFTKPQLLTDDLGYFDAEGYLYIIGRRSQKIITGGENVFPAEVEAAILSTQLVQDVCVVGLPDKRWGQIVVAVYVSVHSSPEAIQQAMQAKLSNYKQPKRWLRVEQLPRNAQGKVNIKQVAQLALNPKK